MAHFKRRRRRRGGIKGCCGLCCLQKTDGRRNGRLRTKQELAAELGYREQVDDGDRGQLGNEFALDGFVEDWDEHMIIC